MSHTRRSKQHCAVLLLSTALACAWNTQRSPAQIPLANPDEVLQQLRARDATFDNVAYEYELIRHDSIEPKREVLKTSFTLSRGGAGSDPFQQDRMRRARAIATELPTTLELQYTRTEVLAVRGDIFACENAGETITNAGSADLKQTAELLELLGFQASVPSRWSNAGDQVTASYAFDHQPVQSRSASGGLVLQRLAEREFCLGIGFGRRMRTIERLMELPDGAIRVFGTIRLFGKTDYDCELSLDHSLLVRNAILRRPPEAGHWIVEYLVTTTGAHSFLPAGALAAEGTIVERRLSQNPSGDDDRSREIVERKSLRLLSATQPVEDEEFRRLTTFNPEPGTAVLDHPPDTPALKPPNRRVDVLQRSPHFSSLLWINLGAVSLASALGSRIIRTRTKLSFCVMLSIAFSSWIEAHGQDRDQEPAVVLARLKSRDTAFASAAFVFDLVEYQVLRPRQMELKASFHWMKAGGLGPPPDIQANLIQANSLAARLPEAVDVSFTQRERMVRRQGIAAIEFSAQRLSCDNESVASDLRAFLNLLGHQESMTGRWSNVGGQRQSMFRMAEFELVTRSDIGLLEEHTIAKREFCMGIGYGKRLVRVEHVASQIGGGLEVVGVLHLWGTSDYRCTLTLDQDDIVRKAVIQCPRAANRETIEYQVRTDGTYPCPVARSVAIEGDFLERQIHATQVGESIAAQIVEKISLTVDEVVVPVSDSEFTRLTTFSSGSATLNQDTTRGHGAATGLAQSIRTVRRSSEFPWLLVLNASVVVILVIITRLRLRRGERAVTVHRQSES
jgi:hypothetical protein